MSEAAEPPQERSEEVIAETTPQKTLQDWHFRVTRAQFGHQLSADKTRWRHLALGIPVVISTTVVGTAAFAAINNDTTSNSWKVAAGIVSILAAILAAVQTFLGYGERSDQHRNAATRYASTRRSIEYTLANHDASQVHLIKGEMDRVGSASPQIDKKAWARARELAEEAMASWHYGDKDALDEPPKHAMKTRDAAQRP
jgi:hypothetical protein